MMGPGELRALERWLRKEYPTDRIFLFGSQANGTARRTSDVDVFIEDGKEVDWVRLGRMRERLSLSPFPLLVDIVLESTTSQEFADAVRREGRELRKDTLTWEALGC